MDDIATHARKLKKRYSHSTKAKEIIDSAKLLAKLVLNEQSLLPIHRKKILSLVQWFISEADGKYKTRFRSKRVVDLAKNEPTSKVKINHDHVYSRAEIVKRIIAEPQKVEEILDQVLGCIVTKEEHAKITSTKSGWEKYSQASIIVLDMANSPPTEFKFMIPS